MSASNGSGQAAETAPGVGAITRDELDDILNGVREDLRKKVDGLHTAVSESFFAAVRRLDERAERKFSAVESELKAHQQTLLQLEQANSDLWDAVTKVRRDLSVAEASSHQRVSAVDPSFDRKVDITLIRVAAREMVAKDAVRDALDEWLQSSNVEPAHFKFEGSNVDKKFSLRMVGLPDSAAKRVSQALGALRLPDGSWRRMSCTSPAGRKVDLFISPDKSPKQIKTEMEGKRLLQAFKSAHPDCNPHLARQDGVLSVSWIPIARISPQQEDLPTEVLWNMAAVRDQGIKRDEVMAAFRASIRTAANVEWDQI